MGGGSISLRIVLSNDSRWYFLLLLHNGRTRIQTSSLLNFLNHTKLDKYPGTRTHKHTRVRGGITSLNERSARRRGRCLQKQRLRRTFMPSAGFELPIPEIERPQTEALDRTATGVRIFW
jgi:hypothetical protein